MPFPQPREAAVSHEDTSLGHTPEPALLAPPPTGEARLRRKGRATLLPRACPPRSHHYSLFTLQSAPPHFDRGGCRQSSPSPRSPSAGAYRARRWFAGGASRRSFAEPVSCQPARPSVAGAFGVARATPVARRSFALPVVEVNGFEPMTSCLQSRRSPS